MRRIGLFAFSLIFATGAFAPAFAQTSAGDPTDQIRWTFIGVLITGGVAIAVALISLAGSIYAAVKSDRQSRATLDETKKQNKDTLDETKRQNENANKQASQTLAEARIAERQKMVLEMLTDFYGPLLTYIEALYALHKLLSSNKPKGFSVLPYLIDPDREYDAASGGKEKVKLSESDKRLLVEMIGLEKSVEELILKKGGLVDDPVLMFDYKPDPAKTEVKVENIGLLSVLLTHFRLQRYAYQQPEAFRGEVDRFKDYVYPVELDGRIRDKFTSLHEELRRLTSPRA